MSRYPGPGMANWNWNRLVAVCPEIVTVQSATWRYKHYSIELAAIVLPTSDLTVSPTGHYSKYPDEQVSWSMLPLVVL